MNYQRLVRREKFSQLVKDLPEIDIQYIPKCIFQTYPKKDKIPKEIFDNIKEYAPEYKHYIYDDSECEIFLKKYFHDSVLHTFLHLELGPHKADLARYCLLYVYGGIYLDIKTELIMPVHEIFKESCTYTVIAYTKDHIYQGVIASPPREKMYLHLIQHIVNTGNPSYYHAFCLELLHYIQRENGTISPGRTNSFYLLEERCSRSGEECYDGLDKWGLCCFIWDHDKPVIKTRRTSYPW